MAKTFGEHMNDLEVIKTPGKWPLWPILPLKRYWVDSARRQTGHLIDPELTGGGLCVAITLGGPPSSPREVVYSDAEALLADDWKVD